MDWRNRFDNFQKHQTISNFKAKIIQIGKMSESPMGFAAIAGLGLMTLISFNINSSNTNTPSPITEDTNNPQTAEQSKSDTAEINPIKAKVETAPLTDTIPLPREETLTLKRNETLIDLLVKRNQIERRNAHAAINAIGKVADLRKLRPGQEIRLLRKTQAQNQIESLKLRTSFDEETVVQFEQDAYMASKLPIDTLKVTYFVEGEIDDSLYLSAKDAGASDKIIIDLIRLMSFDVDFQRDIRSGDTFSIYYRRTFAPEFNDIREDEILSASLTLRGNKHEAIAFTTDDGEASYYDANGKSTQKALMKTPVEGARLSSRFGRRKHPILGYTRLHKGLDFAAPRGTPIMAAGNGTIEMATRNGSFGNYIRIRHGNSYKTAYAHLKSYARGIKKGAKVKQGQIIGYIGTTGRSTGPHLHYEVLLSGKQVNPQSLKLPTARSLKGKELEAFQTRNQILTTEIEQIKYYTDLGKETNLALNSTPTDSSD
jgi:murein DD-endopeptidase MepM/ murein hydrolase activator NlpD